MLTGTSARNYMLEKNPQCLSAAFGAPSDRFSESARLRTYVGAVSEISGTPRSLFSPPLFQGVALTTDFD